MKNLNNAHDLKEKAELLSVMPMALLPALPTPRQHTHYAPQVPGLPPLANGSWTWWVFFQLCSFSPLHLGALSCDFST